MGRHDTSWDDDTEHRQAVNRTRLMVAVASCCSVVVLALVALTVFGVAVFVAVVDALSR